MFGVAREASVGAGRCYAGVSRGARADKGGYERMRCRMKTKSLLRRIDCRGAETAAGESAETQETTNGSGRTLTAVADRNDANQ